MSNQNDFWQSGFRVFGLLGLRDHDGTELDEKQRFKKPYSGGWQFTPDWSEEQFDTMHEMGQFDTGYGVLVNGLLVVDVDARNGGVESFEKLCKDLSLDLLGMAGLAVATGSGGGSMHLYFKAPEGVAMVQTHKDCPGIDFKTSGYVVGPSSLHASGSTYEVIHGHPDDIEDAPEPLIAILKKSDHHRTEYNGDPLDVTEQDIADMLSYYKNADLDYEEWIRAGMAIHDVTGGSGFHMWDDWSKTSEKYDPTMMQRKWHSFGKSGSIVTIATIIHHAKQNGWQSDVTFSTDLTDDSPPSVDLLRPPGFVGEVAKWISSQCFFPREHLAVAAALKVISSIAGMRYKDGTGIRPNLFSLCVAGSGTGKEAIQQAYAECLRAAGYAAAMHGHIKSEQEIIRNFIRHQAAFYCIDEFGMFLKTIVTSASKGGASYLEGVVKILLSAFTKSDGYLQISGDLKEAVKNDIKNELAACYKKIDNNEDQNGKAQKRAEVLQASLRDIDNGIKNPFVNLMGFTTPVTFNNLVSFEMATNGFVGRSLIFNEPETNPKQNKNRAKSKELPTHIAMNLAAICGNGSYEDGGRVEHTGNVTTVSDTEEAKKLLEHASEYFWQQAEEAKEYGLEAIHRRGYELTAKVSLILAIPEGVRTIQHVLWAYEMVKRDCSSKMRLARSNDVEKESPAESVAVKIEQFLTNSQDAETEGVIINRCRPHKKELVLQVLQKIVAAGRVQVVETKHGKTGKTVKKYLVAT